VKNIIDSSIPSEHFIIGETVNPPGNWSSWPPHKHDINDYPNEIDMEEVYYFKVNPPTGFGVQRIYDVDFSEIYVVEDGDTVLIKRGYHPVAAAPGHQVYYLWILGGEERILLPNDDPKFKWQKHLEPLIREIKRG
jgi:5-deoxy-glucuronate isomerase